MEQSIGFDMVIVTETMTNQQRFIQMEQNLGINTENISVVTGSKAIRYRRRLESEWGLTALGIVFSAFRCVRIRFGERLDTNGAGCYNEHIKRMRQRSAEQSIICQKQV